MTKLQELDKFDRAIKDATIRLYSVRATIEQLDKEISVLVPRKNELEQNLEFLKQDNTVPLAQEYKKSKAELSKINTRLDLITSDRDKTYHASLTIEEVIEKLKRDHANLIINSENNILKGNFGGPRGKRHA